MKVKEYDSMKRAYTRRIGNGIWICGWAGAWCEPGVRADEPLIRGKWDQTGMDARSLSA